MKKRAVCVVAAALMFGTGDARAARAVQGVVNINTATGAELELLPRIGEQTAKRIIEFRQKHTYRTPEDLMKVKGIGPGIFKQVKPYLVVVGPTTLTVVSAKASPATSTKGTSGAAAAKGAVGR